MHTSRPIPTLPIITIGLLWFIASGILLVRLLQPYLSPTSPNMPSVMLGYALTYLVALVFGLLLMWGRIWMRPVAVLFHFWLALICFITAFLIPSYPSLTNWNILANFDEPSKQNIVATLFTVVAILSILIAWWFNRPDRWRDFACDSAPKLTVCAQCGSERDVTGKCPYCTYLQTYYEYYLQLVIPGQPLLPGVKRIPLIFEPGHWEIAIGRGVSDEDAYLDANQRDSRGQLIYPRISRCHAYFNYTSRQGLTISPNGHRRVKVNGDNVGSTAALNTGDWLMLENRGYTVRFMVGNEEDQPVALELFDPLTKRSELFCLSQRKDNLTIGRETDNDFVIAEHRGISRHHVKIIYDAADPEYIYIQNLSTQKNALKIKNELIPAATRHPDNPDTIIPSDVYEVFIGETEYLDMDLDERPYRLFLHRYQPETIS